MFRAYEGNQDVKLFILWAVLQEQGGTVGFGRPSSKTAKWHHMAEALSTVHLDRVWTGEDVSNHVARPDRLIWVPYLEGVK